MLETIKEIQALVDLETKGWNEKNPDLFLSIIHNDMVWPWPPTPKDHDPIKWEFVLGRFNYKRWRESWQELFDSHDLIHNIRKTVEIKVTDEENGAFAVVDIDTLWRNKKSGEDFHWKGRVCKIYTKLEEGEWKLISHTGALDYTQTIV